LCDVAFAAYLVVIAAVRAGILFDGAAPAGLDPGNWLAFAHALAGHPVRSEAIVYPPLVPAIVLAAVRLLGLLDGLVLVATASSVVPAVAVYTVLRQAGLGWHGVFAAALLAPAASTGEPTAWGGYPQLLALGVLVGLLAFLDAQLRASTYRGALGLGLCALAMVATSHLITVAAVCAAAVVIALHVLIWPAGVGRTIANLAKAILATMPCLVFAPLYLQLALSVHEAHSAVGPLTFGGILDGLDLLFRDFKELWRALVVTSVLVPVALFAERTTRLWILTTSLLCTMVTLSLVTGEYRYLYLAPIASVLSLGCLLEVARKHVDRRSIDFAITVILVVVLAFQSGEGIAFFKDQRAYYGYLSASTVQALNWLRTDTESQARVAVASISGLPFGWWVEGLSERPTLTSSALKWLNFPDEQARARSANEIFAAPFPRASSLEAARRAGAAYLFVPKNSETYSEQETQLVRLMHPEWVAFENAGAIVLKVPPSGLLN
jgi:hypothetical protein